MAMVYCLRLIIGGLNDHLIHNWKTKRWPRSGTTYNTGMFFTGMGRMFFLLFLSFGLSYTTIYTTILNEAFQVSLTLKQVITNNTSSSAKKRPKMFIFKLAVPKLRPFIEMVSVFLLNVCFRTTITQTKITSNRNHVMDS